MNVNAAMRELLEVFRAVAAQRMEYNKAIREARWAEGPVTIIAGRDSMNAALAGAQAIESLLGWPAAAREAGYFSNYSLAALRPRSIVIAIPGDGQDEEAASAAGGAARRGAIVLGITSSRESALAQCSRALLPLPQLPGEFAQLSSRLATYAALLEISLAAAKIFNPRNPRLADIEFDALPELAGSMNLHLADPIRSMSLQIKDCRRLILAGGGFYYPAALEAAAIARRLTQIIVEPVPVEATADFLASTSIRQDAFLLLSGSHCAMKKRVHAAAARLAASGAQVLAATDANDRGLIESSALSVLAPETPELTGSLLSLFLLHRLILECAANLSRQAK